MDTSISNLANQLRVWGAMAQFGTPLDQVSLDYLQRSGFGDGRTRSYGCLGWIWAQWLSKTPPAEIRHQVEPFVQRGMEMQTLSMNFENRPLHDLLLVHCAIFACSDDNLNRLAERMVDSTGSKGYWLAKGGTLDESAWSGVRFWPRDDGELYASAWSGMLKYSILGDRTKAASEAEVIWKAKKDIAFKATTKQLVAPWLKGDWEAFRKNQKKDFDKLWEQGTKHGAARQDDHQCLVNIGKYSSVTQSWCWAHSGLALLARRLGIEVVTDPFFLPEHAINCVDALK
jgi:hypothetical protein